MNTLGFGDLKPRYKLHERFHREDERLKTFEFWPLNFINYKEMAATGLFYTGEADRTKCYFCEVEIHSWESTDTPVSEHIRWSKNCPLIRRCTTNNVAVNSDELNSLLPQQSVDVCGPRPNYLQHRNHVLSHSEITSKDSPLPTFIILVLSIFIYKELNKILRK